MDSLPIELCTKISKFGLSGKDTNSLKIVSKTFDLAVQSISVRILEFETLFCKPVQELVRCVNDECVGWESIGYNYQYKFNVKYINHKAPYYPYCFFCSTRIYEHIKFGGMLFVNVEYPGGEGKTRQSVD